MSLIRRDLADCTAAERYTLLGGLLTPRPVALVSTLDESGASNLAPYSFLTPGGINPPSLVFSAILGERGRDKGTVANIERTGDFVAALVSREMADVMMDPSAVLRTATAAHVSPKLVSSSPAQFECRLHQIIRHGEEEGAACYVVGEIICAHLHEGVVNGEEVSLAGIGRLAGADYFDPACGKVFEIPPPPTAGEPS